MPLTVIDPIDRSLKGISPEGEDNARTFGSRWKRGVLDLVGTVEDEETARHYEYQWSGEVGFQDFSRANRTAMGATPGKQMGWPAFFQSVREQARVAETRVYDAACGFGGLLDEFFEEPVPEHLLYVGADIHGSLSDIVRPKTARPGQVNILRWDIGEQLPVVEPFDVVVCRASIHHTKDPFATFRNLVSVLKPGGRIAISAYARKGNLREAIDDGIRDAVAGLSPKDAMSLGLEFARVGRALKDTGATIKIDNDLPWMGIKKGVYPIQTFVYDYIMKCWWNEGFGEKYSAVVNFDWYHPTYAFRYDISELTGWFETCGISVNDMHSTSFQHFVDGTKRA